MNRKGSAVWRGGLKSGRGTVSTESGVIKDCSYSFSKRFEDEAGTNPEELVGAAHASCFSMAFSMLLEQAGLTPESIGTIATVTIEKQGEGFAVSKVHLDVQGRVPGADEPRFQQIAEQAKTGCPISKLLKAEITMEAKLLS